MILTTFQGKKNENCCNRLYGNISKPLATKLILEKGQEITVVSSNPNRKKDIEALGAKAAIGQLEDVAFFTETLNPERSIGKNL